MENLRDLNRRIRNIISWRSEYRKKKEIGKNMILETEKAEAEKLYWLMDSCLEFAENIHENIQITTDNPVILEDAKFWIVTQILKIKASWWQHKNHISPGISWLSNAYGPYILENLSESSFAAVESWVDLVNYTDKKLIEFRYPKPQAPSRKNVFKQCFCCFSEK